MVASFQSINEALAFSVGMMTAAAYPVFAKHYKDRRRAPFNGA
tara:strand:- start:53223 stop:53351 length:129 start_codon:yes stop_codon:yes gene_type:complete